MKLLLTCTCRERMILLQGDAESCWAHTFPQLLCGASTTSSIFVTKDIHISYASFLFFTFRFLPC